MWMGILKQEDITQTVGRNVVWVVMSSGARPVFLPYFHIGPTTV